MKARSLLLAAVLLAAGRAGAEEVAATLGSDLAPYREALEGFRAAVGVPVDVLPLGGKPGRDVRVLVAFGGKAASQRYPAGVTLVYALAPGVLVERRAGESAAVKVPMEPAPAALLSRLLALQPGLKRLAVLWASPGSEAAVKGLAKAAAARGVELKAQRLESGDDLPAALRRVKGEAEALWLPADPLVITPRNFEMVKNFAYANDVPFYVPTEALAEKGATAAVSFGYAEAGRAAAAAARAALAGKPADGEHFVEKIDVSLNRAAAEQCGLSVPAAALKAAAKVYP